MTRQPRAQGGIRGLSAARQAGSQAGGREKLLMCTYLCWPMQPDSLALVLLLSLATLHQLSPREQLVCFDFFSPPRAVLMLK